MVFSAARVQQEQTFMHSLEVIETRQSKTEIREGTVLEKRGGR